MHVSVSTMVLFYYHQLYQLEIGGRPQKAEPVTTRCLPEPK